MLVSARIAALHALDRAGYLLALGAAMGKLDARIAPGMFPLGDQIAITGSFARRATVALVDAAFEPDLDWDLEARSLFRLLSEIRAEVVAADGPVHDLIVHRAGEADLRQPPDIYVQTFALPNMWFHLSMAYAILRAEGVALGKADFDGLHVYDGDR